MKLKKVVEYSHNRVIEETLDHLERKKGATLFDCPVLRKKVDASMEDKLVELCNGANDFGDEELKKVSQFAEETVAEVLKTFIDDETLADESSIAYFSRACPNCPFSYKEPIEACLLEKREDLCIEIDLFLLDAVEKYFLAEDLPIEDLNLSIDSLVIDLQHEGSANFESAEEKERLVRSMEKALKKGREQWDSDDSSALAQKVAPFIFTRYELKRSDSDR